jgi:hypothetical protein
METILKEIENAVNAQLYYLAVVSSLALPDICSALEHADGRAKQERYKDWYTAWLQASFPELTPEDMYCLRCGVVHQGTVVGKSGTQYSRIVFHVPNPRAMHINANVSQPSPLAMFDSPGAEAFAGRGAVFPLLTLDARDFCRDIVSAVRRWCAAKQNDPIVKANLPLVVELRPNGFPPHIEGVPVIA